MGLEDMFKRGPDKSPEKMKEAEGALGEMKAIAEALGIELQELRKLRNTGEEMPKREQSEVDQLLSNGETLRNNLKGLLDSSVTQEHFKEKKTETTVESFTPNPRASSLEDSATKVKDFLGELRERKARVATEGQSR